LRNPYVTGAFVTGNRHYGRTALIDHLLRSESRAYWVVGNRRIGKTSLLRQLELLASEDSRLIPLYWDMQGCNSLACIGGYLADALRDHPERLELLGMTPAMLPVEDPLTLLTTLRRLAVREGRELLLLGDETEVLINIGRDEPEAMQRLHRELTGGAGLRVVFTSTRQIYRMHDVCRDWPTSSFLAGFDMSQTLSSLELEAAEALVTQAQAPEAARVQVSPENVDAVTEATNNHPYLLQVLCSRLFQEGGTLRPVTAEDLHVDPLLAGFLEHDFRQLTPAGRQIVLAVHRAGQLEPVKLQSIDQENPADLTQHLHNLEALGYLRRVYGRFAIGNLFLANWLSSSAETLEHVPASPVSETAMRTVFARAQDQDRASLVTQLNARRARLIELEAVRARDFLAVSAPVLDEIEQLQIEIGELRSLLARRQTK
jgi:hypothetical protein